MHFLNKKKLNVFEVVLLQGEFDSMNFKIMFVMLSILSIYLSLVLLE